MTPLLLIRHGPTAWNAERRIQGRSDTALSADGRRAIAAWRLPPVVSGIEAANCLWLTSPLQRARETASVLRQGISGAKLAPLTIEPVLAEMDWGDWEGLRIADVRNEGGESVSQNEARGLDFRPPDGESPRDVQVRLQPLLTRLAQGGRPAIAITHKGVIRALYAQASGWDMTGRPPEKVNDACIQEFLLEPDGRPVIGRLNLPLVS